MRHIDTTLPRLAQEMPKVKTIANIGELRSNITAPKRAPNTLSSVYSTMRTSKDDHQQYIHQENNILFTQHVEALENSHG